MKGEQDIEVDFVVCEGCGRTMPKIITGIKLLDKMIPEKVWCPECAREIEDQMDEEQE